MEYRNISLGPERPVGIPTNFNRIEYVKGPFDYIVVLNKGERIPLHHGDAATFDGPFSIMSEYSRSAVVTICFDGPADNEFRSILTNEYLTYRGFVELPAVADKRAGVALFREFGEMFVNFKTVKNCDVTFFPKAKLAYLQNKPAGFMSQGKANILHSSGDDEIMHLHSLTGYFDDTQTAEWISATGYSGIPQKAVYQETGDTFYIPAGTAVFMAHTDTNEHLRMNLHLIDKGEMRSRYV